MGGVQLKCEMMGGGDRGRREEKKRGRRRRKRAWRSSEAEGWRRGLKSRFDQLIQLQNTGKNKGRELRGRDLRRGKEADRGVHTSPSSHGGE